ncbi:MAG: hypothetical protein PHG16_01975 [Lachnospiraceae bacterium]|nr:hypothetical protein [Lachnospiraceae bacterium]
MSQEKVDRYKKDKANRQKIMRREKWIRRLEYGGSAVVLVALIGWFSFAVYQNVENNKTVEATTYEMNVDAIQSYLSTIQS